MAPHGLIPLAAVLLPVLVLRNVKRTKLLQRLPEKGHCFCQKQSQKDSYGAEMQYAQDASKSAGEYYNNAVVTTPGIENATPVAQGGKLVIDGKVTNATATISKVSVAFVDSAKSATDGTVLNVVNVQFPSVEATINFYMPGIADGASVEALQYTDGAWANVEVAEVRADHVTLNLKGNGVVAFIAK